MVDTKENHNTIREPKPTLFRDGVAQRQPALVNRGSLVGISDMKQEVITTQIYILL